MTSSDINFWNNYCLKASLLLEVRRSVQINCYFYERTSFGPSEDLSKKVNYRIINSLPWQNCHWSCASFAKFHCNLENLFITFVIIQWFEKNASTFAKKYVMFFLAFFLKYVYYISKSILFLDVGTVSGRLEVTPKKASLKSACQRT